VIFIRFRGLASFIGVVIIVLPRWASATRLHRPHLFRGDLSVLFGRYFPRMHFHCAQVLPRGWRKLAVRLMRKHIRVPACSVLLSLLVREPGQAAILVNF
jgi:hypothetical protein